MGERPRRTDTLGLRLPLLPREVFVDRAAAARRQAVGDVSELLPARAHVAHPNDVVYMMSWMMGTGTGDYFVSDSMVIASGGAQRLTSTSQDLVVV